jgi:hypothetical protein
MCKVFAILMKLGIVPDEICLECADIGRAKTNAANP